MLKLFTYWSIYIKNVEKQSKNVIKYLQLGNFFTYPTPWPNIFRNFP